MLKRKICITAGFVVLFVFLVARIGRAVLLANHMDLDHFFNWVGAIVLGMDPFDPANHTVQFKALRAPVFPGMTLLFYPLIAIGRPLAHWLWYGMNIVLMLTIPWVVFEKMGLWNRKFSFDGKTLGLFCLALLFATSRPVLTALQLGQTSILGTALIVGAFLGRGDSFRGICLGVATALKYSLTGLLGVLFLVKRQWRIVFLSFGVFFVFSLIPAFFGNDLVTLYGKYLWGLQAFVTGEGSGGGDTYWGCIGCFSLVHVDFIKSPVFVSGSKLLILSMLGFVFWRERGTKQMGLSTLLFVSAATMSIAYHRHHDLTLPMLFLVTLLGGAIQNRSYGWAAGLSLFVAYCYVPYSLLIGWAQQMGRAAQENSWVYLGNAELEFPLEPIFTLILVLFSFVFWQKTWGKEKWVNPNHIQTIPKQNGSDSEDEWVSAK